MRSFILALVLSSFAFAGPSSNRTIVGQQLKNGSGVFQIPSTGTDQLVMRNSIDTLTNKTMDGATNTWTNIPYATAGTGQVPVANGGTNLASGTSGGILGYTAAGTIASSSLLSANQLIIGGGTGVLPSALAAGSQYQPLVMGASTPGYAALNLAQSAAVTGVLPIANGGSNNGSLSVTAGGVLYTDGTRLQNTGAGTQNQVLISNVGSAPSWGNITTTNQILTSTGATTGYWFTVSSTASSVAAGCTYTNNSKTFVVIAPVTSSSTQIWFTATGAPASSGTLTYSSGGGSACNGGSGTNITFSASVAIATYTVPANVKLLKVIAVGGGGAGGGVAISSSNSAAGAGGGGGGTCIKYIASPSGTYYYSVGTGGAAGASTGANGVLSSFVGGTGGATAMVATQGSGGAAGIGATTNSIVGPGKNSVASTGCDIVVTGGSGGIGWVLSATVNAPGYGGNTFLATQGSPSVVGGGNGAGSTGNSYGGGGTGAGNVSAGSASNGGAGANGIVWVEEYY